MERSPVNRRAAIIVVLVMAGLAVWVEDAAGQRLKQPKPDLDAGERIYKQNCINCHGPSGKGDGAAAEQLNPKPADLTSPATQATKYAGAMDEVKRRGPGPAASGWMSHAPARQLRSGLALMQ